MIETGAANLPFQRKSDLDALKYMLRVRKYKTVLALRDGQRLPWEKIGERIHYSVPEVRRMYFRAKELAAENPELRSAGAGGAVPVITKEEVKLIEARAINSLYRAVLDMRGAQGLMYKEISELTGFSISRLIGIYGKASSMRQAVAEKARRPVNEKHEPDKARIPEHEMKSKMIRKGDAWLLKAGINAQKYKSVLELRDGQKLSWRKIGERMHYSQSQVHRYYIRAKKLLALSGDSPDMSPETGESNSAPIVKHEDVRFGNARIRNEIYRTILTLRDDQHLTFKEISERTGYSKTTIRNNYYKAARLKQTAAEQSVKTM